MLFFLLANHFPTLLLREKKSLATNLHMKIGSGHRKCNTGQVNKNDMFLASRLPHNILIERNPLSGGFHCYCYPLSRGVICVR